MLYSRNKRAIALATTLIVAVVLTMLVVALINTQRTRSQSLSRNIDQYNCDLAIESALEACFAEIQNEREQWGKEGFKRTSVVGGSDLENKTVAANPYASYTIDLLPTEVDPSKTSVNLLHNQSYMNFSLQQVDLTIDPPPQESNTTPHTLKLQPYTGLLVIQARAGTKSKQARVLVGSTLAKENLKNLVALSGGTGIHTKGDVSIAAFKGYGDRNTNLPDPSQGFLDEGDGEESSEEDSEESSYEYEYEENDENGQPKKTRQKILLDPATVYLNSSKGKISWEENSGDLSTYIDGLEKLNKEDKNWLNLRLASESEESSFRLRGELHVPKIGQVTDSIKSEINSSTNSKIKTGARKIKRPFAQLNLDTRFAEAQKSSGTKFKLPNPKVKNIFVEEGGRGKGKKKKKRTSATRDATNQNNPGDPKKTETFNVPVITLEKGQKYYLKEGQTIPSNINLNGASLYVNGDLKIQGQFWGEGGVYVKGSTTLRGKTNLTASTDNVALYSQKDIFLLRGRLTDQIKKLNLKDSEPQVQKLTRSISELGKQASYLSNPNIAKLKESRRNLQIAFSGTSMIPPTPSPAPSQNTYFTQKDYNSLQGELGKIVEHIESLQDPSSKDVSRLNLAEEIEYSIDIIATAIHPDIATENGYEEEAHPFAKLDLLLGDTTSNVTTLEDLLNDNDEILERYNDIVMGVPDNSDASFKGLLCSQAGSIVSMLPLNILGVTSAEGGFIASSDLHILADTSLTEKIFLENIGTYESLLWLP